MPPAKPIATNKTKKKGKTPKKVKVPQSKLDGLEASFKPKVVAVLKELAGKGWKPYVAEGLRNKTQQAEKVKKGYSKTMNSMHLTGQAADIVDYRWGWGGEASNLNHQFWKDLGAAGKAQGLEWGGDWKKFKDVAHIQEPRSKQIKTPAKP